MCGFDEEEKVLQPTFDLEAYVPDLEKTIKDLLMGNVQFDKLEPLTVSSHILERFVNTKSSYSRLSVKLVFHGTMTSNFPNIQKRGFLVPGNSGLPIVNGNAYGSGIYLSTCPKMSLSYVRDQPKLLVCALLEGDKNKVTTHGVIRVAKDPAYVIPCFILHYKGSSPRLSSPYQRFMSNPHFHTFLFCLISLFKILVLLIIISVICFIGSLSCLGYSYFMDRPPNEVCYEVNTLIWNSYVYLFYSIILYGLYYLILWPLYYLIVIIFWLGNSLVSLVSWMIFWIIYFGLVILINANMIILGFCITPFILAALYSYREPPTNAAYYRRERKYISKKD